MSRIKTWKNQKRISILSVVVQIECSIQSNNTYSKFFFHRTQFRMSGLPSCRLINPNTRQVFYNKKNLNHNYPLSIALITLLNLLDNDLETEQVPIGFVITWVICRKQLVEQDLAEFEKKNTRFINCQK